MNPHIDILTSHIWIYSLGKLFSRFDICHMIHMRGMHPSHMKPGAEYFRWVCMNMSYVSYDPYAWKLSHI